MTFTSYRALNDDEFKSLQLKVASKTEIAMTAAEQREMLGRCVATIGGLKFDLQDERQISHDRRVALLCFDEAECEDRKRIGVLERVLLSVYEQLEVAKDVIEDSGVDGPTFTLESLKNITDAATKTFTAKLAFLKAKR